MTALNANIASLNHRNSRLKLNRATLNADMAREVCGVIPLDFGEYVQADFVIYLYFEQRSKRWWPDSNIFAADRHGSFPIFLRATSEPLRSELLGLLLLASSDALSDMKEKLRDGRLRSPRWSSAFSTLDVWSLGNFEAIMDSLDSS